MRNSRTRQSVVACLLLTGGVTSGFLINLRNVSAMPVPSDTTPPVEQRSASGKLLPRLIHHKFGPQVTDTLKPVSGYTLDARAWRDPNERVQANTGNDDFVGRSAIVVEVRLRHKKSDSDGIYWQMEDEKLTEEWDFPPSKDEFTIRSFTQKEGGGGMDTSGDVLIGFAAPSPDVQHWVRVSGRLRRHETLNECVTFHDVPVRHLGKGWIIAPPKGKFEQRTPNGVVVTLWPLSEKFSDSDIRAENCPKSDHEIGYQVAANIERISPPDSDHPAMKYTDLPLAMPVSDDTSQCKDHYATTDLGMTSGICEITPSPRNNCLKSITLLIVENAPRESVPFALTVPIKAGRPKDVWVPEP